MDRYTEYTLGLHSFRQLSKVGGALCLMLALCYLPAALFGISSNPLYRHSGLTSHTRRGLIPGIPAIDPNVGTTIQSLGHLSAEEWLHGRVPWWNYYAGVGLPLAAEMQSQSLFLPFVFLLHFSGGVILLRLVMQLIAGISTYALLKQLRLGNLASFLGAVFYAFNGTFAWWGDDPMMPAAFLPLFLLGIERAAESARNTKRAGWVWIAVGLAYSLYAGFPETALLNGVLALCWALLRLLKMPPHCRLAFAFKVTVGGVTGLLLTAPLLIPFIEYVQHTAVPHSGYGQGGLPTASFLQIFLPYIYGPIEGFIAFDSKDELILNWANIGGFLGITVVFLAMLSILGERRERALKILLLVWTALTMARTINVSLVTSLFNLIPGMDYLAVFRYSSESFEMAMAVLAAFAVDRWRRGSVSRLQVQVALLATAFPVAIGFWSGLPMMERLLSAAHKYPIWLWGSIGFAALQLGAIVVLCAGSPTRRRVNLVGLVVAVECIVLYSIPTLSGVRDVALDLRPLAYLREHLGWQRAFALGAIHPNYGSYYQVPFLDHQMIPVSGDWMKYVRKHLDAGADPITFSGDFPAPLQARRDALRLNVRGFEEAAVRYVAVPHNTNPFAWPAPVMPPTAVEGTGENVPLTPVGGEPNQPKRIFQSTTGDLFELSHPAPYMGTSNESCVLIVESRESARTSCRAADTLIRRELFYPGWHALVNGREVPLRASSAFQALDVPAGGSKIEFRYSPTNLGPACMGGLLGLVLLAAGPRRLPL